jgi:glyoxylate reductase
MNNLVLPKVLAPAVLNPTIVGLLDGKVEWVSWEQPSEDIQGIYCYGHRSVTAELMDACGQLRVISNHGVGVDHIDLEAARQRRIPVGNTPDVLNGAVADMTFALLLAAARRLTEGERYARDPQTTAFGINDRHGRDVHGSTLGIIGMGKIGLEIAKRARGFDMKVLYHNRHPRKDLPADCPATYTTFEGLLQQSDFVVLMMPLTPDTYQLIGRRELAQMKPTATLVNIARGGVVDTDALTEAMQAGQIFAAALDVTDPEPLPRDHPLLTMDRVTITPHLGSATVQTRRKMAELSVQNLLAGLSHQTLPSRIA